MFSFHVCQGNDSQTIERFRRYLLEKSSDQFAKNTI